LLGVSVVFYSLLNDVLTGGFRCFVK
jgi:hypothetical protein